MRRVLGENETLLQQHIDGVFAFAGVVLRALVAFFECDARIAVRKSLLLWRRIDSSVVSFFFYGSQPIDPRFLM